MTPLDKIEQALLSMPRHKGDIVEQALHEIAKLKAEIENADNGLDLLRALKDFAGFGFEYTVKDE